MKFHSKLVTSSAKMDRPKLLAALGELNSILDKRGTHIQISIYGGAGIMLLFPDFGRATKDIDATYDNFGEDQIASAIEEVAYQQDLPFDWLNNECQPYTWSPNGMKEGPSLSNIKIMLPPPAYLLASKLLAGRPVEKANDAYDIQFLMNKLGIDGDKAFEIFEKYFPGRKPNSFAIEEMYNRKQSKIAKPIEIPSQLLDSIMLMVKTVQLTQTLDSASFSLVSSLSPVFPGIKVDSLFIGWEPSSGQLHVEDAYLHGSEITIELKGDTQDFSQFALADTRSAIAHELAHAIQREKQGEVDFNANKDRAKLESKHDNHEMKAVSSEMCRDYADKLVINPNLSIEEFLNDEWRWQQIKSRSPESSRKRILSDLGWVWRTYGSHSSGTRDRTKGEAEALKKSSLPRVAKAPYKTQEFEGFTILIGRSAADNDTLSMEVANPNDFWLHAASVPGSHVVVRNPDNLAELPAEVLQEAARQAVGNSKAKGQLGVPVVLGKAGDLSKPSGSAVGEIHISQYKTIKV
jgi:hypothetical protein